MKRDMDVIRAIMLAVRDDHRDRLVNLEGVETNIFKFHAHLLIDGGFAEGRVHRTYNGPVRLVELFRLTWKGHDFIDSVADDMIWAKTKKKITSSSISWTFDILKEVAVGFIKEGLNL